MPADPTDRSLTRRSFLAGAGGVAAGGVLAGAPLAAAQEEQKDVGSRPLRGEVSIALSVNGERRELRVEPRTTLLSALRWHLSPPLTGTKDVCDRGNCGACTVLVDRRPAYACLLLAVDLVGRDVVTVEGIGAPSELSPVQQAFCEHDASMCGFCTPGFVVATTACLERNPRADRDEIRRELSGNLCRCGTYPHLFEAAREAGTRMAEAGRGEDR